jgi:peptidoglycan/xylan/chitin deacetylase (PgdA/CDA1 family)
VNSSILGLRVPLVCLAAAGITANLAPAATRMTAVRGLFPRLKGTGDSRHVALTFDDGPDPASTPEFLRMLEELEVKATFFLLGEMVRRSPSLAREIVQQGHEVGVHGWDHRSLALRGPIATARQIRDATAIIHETTGRRPIWWRPPYGVLTWSGVLAARREGLTPILWGSWGHDWTANASSTSVMKSLLVGLRPGCTVLLHDSSCTSAQGSWRSALGALPELISRCRDEALEVGPLQEHWAGR